MGSQWFSAAWWEVLLCESWLVHCRFRGMLGMSVRPRIVTTPLLKSDASFVFSPAPAILRYRYSDSWHHFAYII
jgi:hypothetical protein